MDYFTPKTKSLKMVYFAYGWQVLGSPPCCPDTQDSSPVFLAGE
jgi:hypothetical protein